MGERIFLSYRREDSAGYAGRLSADLAGHFGRHRVFMDIDTIEPGADFVDAIRAALSGCMAVLVVIGRRWADSADAAGRRRLDDPDDLVRKEVAIALGLDIRVIPVLVDGAAMPLQESLPPDLARLARRNALEISNARWEFDAGRLVDVLSRLVVPSNGADPSSPDPAPSGDGPEEIAGENPFTWRAGIAEPAAFFGREGERRTLRDYLRGRQNCQVVGPRRIGKTSLLRQAGTVAAGLGRPARVALLDLQDPRCATLPGWMRRVARSFGWPRPPGDLPDFAECVEEMLEDGSIPVLCLDEFGEFLARPAEFPREFFLTLRFCGQQGLSIVTAAQEPLSALTDPDDQTSPFFNTFPVLRLGPFSEREATAYVDLSRPGIRGFAGPERSAILGFARCHPLALQVACYHVLAAREVGDGLERAIHRARQDMENLLPSW